MRETKKKRKGPVLNARGLDPQVIALPGPGKGVSHPNRVKSRQQVTIRLDEKVRAGAQAWAESRGLRITDACEEALWLLLQQQEPDFHVRQGRLLWSVIPVSLQRVTLGLWALLSAPDKSVAEQLTARFLVEVATAFRDDPRYGEALESAAGWVPLKKVGR